MGKTNREILGIPIETREKDIILEEIRKYLKQTKDSGSKLKFSHRRPLEIFTLNPEIICLTLHDKNFKEVVETASLNIPDGSGVVWALNFLYGETVSKIPGVDFIENLVEIATKEPFTIGLIGGRGKVALEASECLKSRFPNLATEVFEEPEVLFTDSQTSNPDTMTNPIRVALGIRDEGMEKNYFEDLAVKIREKAVKIVFVGLGFPKQEYFIRALGKASAVKSDQPLVLMAVGGSFDVIAGKIPRAPLYMRNSGLEWLFRLMIQPWRLQRQMKGIEFFYRVMTVRK